MAFGATLRVLGSRAIRATYGFLPDLPDEVEFAPALWDAIRRDPLNPAMFTFPGDPEDPGFERDVVRSVLEGPDAPPNAYPTERPGVGRGTVHATRFRSELLGNERRVGCTSPRGTIPRRRPTDCCSSSMALPPST